MNYRSFNIEPFSSDVCGDHRCPQTLAEICRNMDSCCGFRAVAAREKYPGLTLFKALTLFFRTLEPVPNRNLRLTTPEGDVSRTEGMVVKMMNSWYWTKKSNGTTVRQQAITWANADSDFCCHMASLGHNEYHIQRLTLTYCFQLNRLMTA